MKLITRTCFVCMTILLAFTPTFGQSIKKIKLNVSVMERRNAASYQLYQKLKHNDIIIYKPNKAFERVRIFHVELDPETTRKKYPEAVISNIQLSFYAGNDVEIGTWNNKLRRPHHKDEIWAGYDKSPKVMNDATYAKLTTTVQVKKKTLNIVTFITLKQ